MKLFGLFVWGVSVSGMIAALGTWAWLSPWQEKASVAVGCALGAALWSGVVAGWALWKER